MMFTQLLFHKVEWDVGDVHVFVAHGNPSGFHSSSQRYNHTGHIQQLQNLYYISVQTALTFAFTDTFTWYTLSHSINSDGFWICWPRTPRFVTLSQSCATSRDSPFPGILLDNASTVTKVGELSGMFQAFETFAITANFHLRTNMKIFSTSASKSSRLVWK
jgi:hypothetical protein